MLIATDAWTVVLAVATAAGAVASAVLAFYVRERKLLKYIVVSDQRFAIRGRSPKLKVSYATEPVEDVRIIGLVFRCQGTRDLDKDDFPRLERPDGGTDRLPLHISVKKRDESVERAPRIVGAEVIDWDPDNVRLDLEPDMSLPVRDGVAVLRPFHFVRGRSFSVQLVVADSFTSPTVHLTGTLHNAKMRKVDPARRRKFRNGILVGGFALFIVTVAATLIVSAASPHTRTTQVQSTPQISTLAGTLLLTALGISAVGIIGSTIAALVSDRRQRREVKQFEG